MPGLKKNTVVGGAKRYTSRDNFLSLLGLSLALTSSKLKNFSVWNNHIRFDPTRLKLFFGTNSIK